jgi:hypothetical protein
MVAVLAFVLNLVLLIVLVAIVRNRLTLLIHQAVDHRFASLQNKLDEMDNKLDQLLSRSR